MITRPRLPPSRRVGRIAALLTPFLLPLLLLLLFLGSCLLLLALDRDGTLLDRPRLDDQATVGTGTLSSLAQRPQIPRPTSADTVGTPRNTMANIGGTSATAMQVAKANDAAALQEGETPVSRCARLLAGIEDGTLAATGLTRLVGGVSSNTHS
jgi:hypothetical protein